jgi:hypothetical protein
MSRNHDYWDQDGADSSTILVDERHRYVLDPLTAAAARGAVRPGAVRGGSRELASSETMDEIMTDGLHHFM